LVTIRVAEERLELQESYYPALPSLSKQICRKWLGADIGRVFSPEEEQALRKVFHSIWAVDGSPDSPQEAVELQIIVDERDLVRSIFIAYQSQIFLAGGEIATALKNRRGARPGRGVKLLSGKTCFVLSYNSWMTAIPNAPVFLIRDVLAGTTERFREVVGDAGRVDVRTVERH